MAREEEERKVDRIKDALVRLSILAADTYWHGIPRIEGPIEDIDFLREHVLTGTPAVFAKGSLRGLFLSNVIK